MNIIKYKKIFLGISTALVLIAVAVVGAKGLDYGVEFTGGAVLEMSYDERPSIEEAKTLLVEKGFEVDVQNFGEKSLIIKTQDVSEEGRKSLTSAMSSIGNNPELKRFNSIGPSVGRELRTKSLYALIFVSLGIIFFVAYAFRSVSKPVSSWKYGLVAVIALLHDIMIPVGILTLLGTEIDTLYVVGLLSILGLSVNDTIVVFDRVREELAKNNETSKKEDFDDTVGYAVSKTVTRSILTSLTLVVVLLALYYVGPVATQTLALVLLLGTIVGTYSSIFLASPLLTYMVSSKKEEKKKK
ncbi:MAG: protein translocase subunit SecF [Candidatus Pacebacteria bacterium]|nr:protein translocase subunit SecF [Candidatus Paceibacterota bacterium]